MKTIEHGKFLSVCRHTGESWFVALSKTLTCTGTTASAPEMEAIVDSMRKREAHWHSGILFTPGLER